MNEDCGTGRGGRGCGHDAPGVHELAYALRAMHRAGIYISVISEITNLNLSHKQARDLMTLPSYEMERWLAALMHTRLSEEIGGD